MTTETNPEVLAICYAKGWAAHSDYMLKSEAEAVTNIGTAFDGSSITHFEEFEYFTGVTIIASFAFRNASTTSLVLPQSITTINAYGLQMMKKLEEIEIPAATTTIGSDFLRDVIVLTKCVIWGTITTMNRPFYNANKMNLLVLPSTLTSITDPDAFIRCYDLAVIIMKSTTPPTLANQRMFSAATNVGDNQRLYVPDASVNNYKAASIYSDYSNRIYGFSQLQVDHPDYYNEYI